MSSQYIILGIAVVLFAISITLVVKAKKSEHFMDSGLQSYLASKCVQNGNRPVVLTDFEGNYVTASCDQLAFALAEGKN